MSDRVPEKPTFREAFAFWLKLGFISFGGPTGQIAIMHEEVVERRKWIVEHRFLHALNFCMLLPGPEAQQLATYIGWLLHGTKGGLAAGILFVLPSVFILWGLSYIYMAQGHVPWIAALFDGLKPAVLALVAAAVLRIGRKTLTHPILWLIAAGSLAAIAGLHSPFPLILCVAALVGLLARKQLPTPKGHGDGLHELDPLPARPWQRAAIILGVGLTLWWLPTLAMHLAGHDTLRDMGLFFSKAAMVTFGGAYAVLPYVGQQAVSHYGWLSAEQMMAGLGLAESTPGPMIMVLQYVGFVGAWQHPGDLPTLLAATLGAALTTWVTFAPCFLFIFLGAPYVERMRSIKAIHAAMTAITAAVVGVIANLGIWFAVHALQAESGAFRWDAALLTMVFFVGLWRFRWNTVAVVVSAAAIGVLLHAV